LNRIVIVTSTLRENPVDNPTNASHHNTSQNRHTSLVNLNRQISAQTPAVFRSKLPHSISHLAAARQ